MNTIKENSKVAFNQQAATYDKDIKGQHARSLYPVLLEKLSHIPFQSALDLGCGTGEMLKLILQKDPHKELCGIDLSEEMLAVAKSKLPEQVKLLLGDSEVLPFPDNAFDVVYCNDSFHHYPAPQNVLREVNRVLKHGGIFMICNGSDGENESDEKWVNIIEGMSVYNEDQLHSALEKAGFYKIKCYINTEKHWLCIFAKKK